MIAQNGKFIHIICDITLPYQKKDRNYIWRMFIDYIEFILFSAKKKLFVWNTTKKSW